MKRKNKICFDFKTCINLFEKIIVIKGVLTGRFSKVELVSTRQCKLFKTNYGRALGENVNTKIPLVIDYYGYLKHSKGFDDLYGNASKKLVKTRIVHFASIKIEDIEALDSTGLVLTKFVRMKNQILTLKGFKRKNRLEDS